ncbi:hypothetical protein, partial [Klebsiella pneumoniae]|uniref:hypothetical protein n=1 Tax=Klebsiella pneumoniae TaxID=573 RepID=UPI001D0DAD94
ITRHQLNSQRTGETGNMKKNQPTLLTEGCIYSWGQVKGLSVSFCTTIKSTNTTLSYIGL